jgi:ParB family chromosome partitioning protein
MLQKNHSLGRGLASLLGDSIHQDQGVDGDLPVSQIHPSENQPRKYFNLEELENLKNSIQEKGLLQPILVRPHPTQENAYEIIAGERRWRACKELGFSKIPAIVKHIGHSETLEIALIENIQRENLNPLEEAEGYKRLMDEYAYTQETLSKIMGKSRSHIANILRLNNASENVKKHLRESRITFGHAKVLLTYNNPDQILEDVIQNGYSVRETEELIRQTVSKTRVKPSKSAEKSYDIQVIEEKLRTLLGMNVEVELRGEGGKLKIDFRSVGDLDNLMILLDKTIKPKQVLAS